MAHLAPSSSNFTCGWTYDVFLSFRGEDTRTGFTGNLYNALHQKGIHTFIDDGELRRGEEITSALLKAIEESRIAITVLSKNYASSTFCLEELVKILECVRGKGRLVWPVFYDVDPSEVRHQRGCYGEALAKHGKISKDKKEKVQKWRLALNQVANLSGWHFKNGHEYEHAFIGKIVKEVSCKLDRIPLHIANYPVGLESRVLEVNLLLDVGSDDGVHMVGIYGIGGIGKSTIARAIYNLIADSFEGLCFLADVRENSIMHGLVHLQEMLLSEIVGEKDIKLGNVNKGIPIIKHRLQRKKVLLILDDVDKLDQLQALAGGRNWFGSGSRIIITTRDKHLLACHGVERMYEVKELSHEEALELFSWNAFRNYEVDPTYMDISNRIILYASGLPLALEVISSNLFGRKLIEWNSALDKYQSIPNKEVQEILKVSYDALEEDEQEIFLDIACCFKGDTVSHVIDMLHVHGFHPEHGIEVLTKKSLIRIDEFGCVTMHDLIQAMGREIVRLESPKEPGNRSRLWFFEDILHVLEENTGTDKIEVIVLDFPKDKEVDWNGKALKKMTNLKILIIQNARFSRGPRHLPNSLRVLDWRGYPSSSLPSDFLPKKLVMLKLPDSCFNLDKPLKKFESLSLLDVKGCRSVRQVPDLSGAPNLMELNLDGCTNLVEVHDSVGFLDKLRRLSATECTKLSFFARAIRLTSLEFLNLSGCSSLQSFPEILGTMENIRDVYLSRTGIEELPSSFQNLIGLEKLELTECRRLQQIREISPNLKVLSAINCPSLTSQSSSILLSQDLHKTGNTKFILTGATVPEWLDHYNKEDSVVFWFRKKFPAVALCVVGEIGHEHWNWSPDIGQHHSVYFGFRVYINGTKQSERYYNLVEKKIVPVPDHILLVDLKHLVRTLVVKDNLDGEFSEHGWNHAEVKTELLCDYHQRYMTTEPSIPFGYICGRIKWSGIHVYKQKDSMVDIQFTNPAP